MTKNLTKLMDLWVPADLRRLHQIDLLLRARALVGGLLLMGVLALLMLIPIGEHLGDDPVFKQLVLPLTLIILATAVMSLWLFRTLATFTLSTHLFAVIHTLVQATLILITGGMSESPLAFVFAIQPVLTFVMAGRRAGVAWLFIIFAVSTSLDAIGNLLQVPQVSMATRELLRQYIWIAGCTTFFACMWYLDLINRRLAAHISRERDVAQFAAAHDPMTGLLNRSTFAQRLANAVQRAQFSSQPLALIYVDLDGFKEINDTLGHHAGDALLQKLAQRLRQCVRNTDSVARLGGDEFSLLLEGADRSVLERILPEILREMSAPVTYEDQDISVSASIGAAMLPGDAGDPEVLSRCADHAMYRAKSSGRNRFIFYSDTTATVDTAP